MAGAMIDLATATVQEIIGRVRLIARVDPANAASVRVLTRRGFAREANQNGLDRYVLVQTQEPTRTAQEPSPCAGKMIRMGF